MTMRCLCAVLVGISFCGLAAASPNVVLITADTLRADRLGLYGYEQNTSPCLDKLGREGLVFDDCICDVPLTTPSFSILFTSLYPRMTGATRNGLTLPVKTPLITERFKVAGYQTFGIQSNWPLKRHLAGVHRGFDVYEDAFHKKRWGFMNPERDAVDVTDTALRVLAQRDLGKPFFCWVHYSDPHAPYQFHPAFNPDGKKLWRLGIVDRIRTKYDSEIAYMDYHIGRLLAELPKENTIILFTGDHGESLYEHGYLGHGRRIYQDNEHIPLFITGSGIVPGRSSAPVSMLDVGPTLLGLAGIAPAPGMLGCNILAGEIPVDRIRYIEAYGGAVPKIPGAKILLSDHHTIRQGLIQQGWKFIMGGAEPELYYLPDDPGELRNLGVKEPARVHEYKKCIEAWAAKHPRVVGRRAELSTDDVRALESLGYLH